MIKMNFYVSNGTTASTADMLRGCANSLNRVADSMDKPNEIMAMLNDVFDIITREKVAEKIEQLGAGLISCSMDLRGPVIDQRPMPK